MRRCRAPFLALVLVALTACASKPIVYPNEKLRQSGNAAVEADTEACMAQAKEYLESGRVPEMAKNTGEGAVVGGAVGAAVGAVRGDLGNRTAAGAAGGAAGALAHGLFHSREPTGVEKRYVERCLAERGYEVIGWK